MNIKSLHYLLQPLHLIRHLLFIIQIHSTFYKVLHSHFFLCVELKNRCKGCNIYYNYLKYKCLDDFKDVIEDVKDVKDVNFINLSL